MPEQNRSPKENLDHILDELKSGDAARIRAAITELGTYTYSSPAILNHLEQLALHSDEEIREAALTALTSSTHRYVRSQVSKIPKYDRNLILNEINSWMEQGLIDSKRADVIKQRYNFDITPPPSKPIPAPIKPAVFAPKPAHVAPPPPPEPAPIPAQTQTSLPESIAQPALVETTATPPAPRRTLMQALLSETSIKIALYLGAFFVVASAIILATLVAAARLPILFIATAIFGAGSFAINKRLPQPSFALFIVASFLLPITANVLDAQLELKEPGLSIYWTLVALMMSIIWVYATRVYSSRLFTITAFLALDFSALRFASIFQDKAQPELFIAMLGLASLAGLGGTRILKNWRDSKFALPLFIVTQIQQPALLIVSLSFAAVRVFGTEVSRPWWLVTALVWGLAFVFYLWSEALFPVFLFPWLAAGVLIPVAWLVTQTFDPTAATSIIVVWVWGMILSLVSEAVYRRDAMRKFSLPLLMASIPLFIVTHIWGLIENITLGFACLLGTFIVYTILHTIRARGWLWAIALVTGLSTYFTFYNLTFIKNAEVFFGYQLLIASLLLLLPDLFLKADFKDNPAWRIPPRILGTILVACNFLVYAPSQIDPLINTAVVFGVYAFFFAAYSLRYQRPNLGYSATTFLALSALYTANNFNSNLWLPILSTFAAAFYLSGFFLRNESRTAWSNMLRYSGLALATIVFLVVLATLKETGGWYMLIISLFYTLEMHKSKQNLFELGAQLFFPAALFIILRDLKVTEPAYAFTGIGLIWLSLDLVFKHTYKQPRLLTWPIRGLGGIAITAAITLLSFSFDKPFIPAVCFTVYAVYFTFYALAHKQPLLAYLATASAALTASAWPSYLNVDLWLQIITALSVLYYVSGFLLTRNEDRKAWGNMLRYSGLAIGSITSLIALTSFKYTSGWYMLIIGALFVIEMFHTQQSLFEIGAHILFPAAFFVILNDFKIHESGYILLGMSLIWFGLDLVFSRTFKGRLLELPVRLLGALASLTNTVLLIGPDVKPIVPTLCFAGYAIFFTIYTYIQQKEWMGYVPAAYLPLTIIYALTHQHLDLWLPILTLLSVIYFAAGFMIRQHKGWSEMLRNSGLGLGALVAIAALIQFKSTGGYYALIIGILFGIETFLRQNGKWEAGMPVLFNIGAALILNDFKVHQSAYYLLALSLIWLGSDIFHHRIFKGMRHLQWPIRGLGGLLALAYTVQLLALDFSASHAAWVCFAVSTVFFAAYALLYRRPLLGYIPAAYLPLAVFFLLRDLNQNKWLWPLIIISMLYYTAGYLMRRAASGQGWETTLLFSGISLATLTAASAPLQSGLDSVIPVAIAATIWAVEAFARRNVWLGFPTNALYLMAYFMILYRLNVDEPQFFSMGAALLGLVMHYLLTRTGSKTGAFITGMVSQLVLLSTTYIQMFNTEKLGFFVVLFLQSLVVLIYGIVIRSRSLVFIPIVFSVLGVVTVIYSALKGISTVVLIGCTGIILLLLGILAVVMRERLIRLGEQFSDWQA